MTARLQTTDKDREKIFTFINDAIEQNTGIILISSDGETGYLKAIIHHASSLEIAMGASSLIEHDPATLLPLTLVILRDQVANK